MTTVIPLYVGLLNSKVERLTELSSSAASTAKELEHVKNELAETRATLQISLQKSPFQGRSVYPTGFSEVVIGTTEAELVSRYPDGTWDEEHSDYSVVSKLENAVSEATYFMNKSGEKNSVSMILYHLRNGEKAGTDITRKHLLTTFGEADAAHRDGKLWKATEREWVILAPADGSYGTYYVYPANSDSLTARIKAENEE